MDNEHWLNNIVMLKLHLIELNDTSGVDPGFPILGGAQPLTADAGENVKLKELVSVWEFLCVDPPLYICLQI